MSGSRAAGAFGRWRRRGGSAVQMSQIVALRSLAQAVNIATGLVTAAMLGADGRGQLAALTTAPGFLAGVASIGLHASLIYQMKAAPEQERALLGNGLLLTFVAGVLAAAIGWLLLPGWLVHYPPQSIAVGRWLILSVPLTMMTWTMMGAAEARGWFAFANRTLYLQSTAILLLLLVLWRLHALSPVTAAFAYLFPTLPVFLYFAYYTLRRMAPDFTPNPQMMRRLVHYGLRLCGVDLLSSVSGYADQLLVIAVCPAGTVGAYVVALSAARLLSVIQSGVVAVLFPKIAARTPALVVRSVIDCFRAVFLITGVAAIVLGVAGPGLLMLIYGHGFAGAIAPFRLLLLASLMSNSAAVLSQAYAACGRPGLVTLGEAAGLSLSLCLMLVLVPAFGTTGAAAAVLASAALRLLAFALGIRVFLHRDAGKLLPGTADVARLRRALAGLREASVAPVMEPLP